MDFTEEELQVLKDILSAEKQQEAAHGSRVAILEKIVEGMEAAPTQILIDRVFEIMSHLPQRTLNSVSVQIHAEKILKGSKQVVYDKILSLFEEGVEKNGKRVRICYRPDCLGNTIRHLHLLT